MLPRRGWVGWIEENSKVLGAISVWIFILCGGIGALVASTTGNHNGPPAALVSPQTSASSTPAATGSAAARGKIKSGGKTGKSGAPTSSTTSGTGGSNTGSTTTQPKAPTKGVVSQPQGQCSPTQPKAANGQPETGITAGSVTIGEIISDVSQLPQQFHPTYEGLSAWANLVNKSGGICGRRINIQYRNDQVVNFRSEYQSLERSVFSFVAMESLRDGDEYQSSPRFMPQDKDSSTNEYVPDVGGLALAYPRAQSPMHWGIFGSLSPTLVGGGASHVMTHTAPGTKCKLGGVVYLQEPTGASKDQADIGQAALNASWGGGLPSKEYSQPLGAQQAQWDTTVQQMIQQGVNCVFTYADEQSNVNLLGAMHDQGVWPPNQCTAARKAANQCFVLTYMPFTSIDARFVSSAGPYGSQVTSYAPHVPLDETGNPAVKAYLDALAQCKKDGFAGCGSGNDEPSTFSVIGFASGEMFGEALAACGSAPTRACIDQYMNNLSNFNASGLIAPITPSECIKVNYNGHVWCYKEIFHRWVMTRELGSPSQGIDAFRRIYPSSGFAQDKLHIVRGTAA